MLSEASGSSIGPVLWNTSTAWLVWRLQLTQAKSRRRFMNPQSSPPERGKAWRARNRHSAGIDRCHLLDRVELDPTLGIHELRRRLRDHNRNEVRRAVSSCPFSAPIR